MAEAHHFCPECGAIDLTVEGRGVLDGEGTSVGTATCPNCSWHGPLSATTGMVSSESFFDINKVGDILLRVISTNAAGPLVQVLEYLGLIPRDADFVGVEGAEAKIQDARDHVMQRILADALDAAFTGAQEATDGFKSWLKATHPHQHTKYYGADKQTHGAPGRDKKKADAAKKSRRKNR